MQHIFKIIYYIFCDSANNKNEAIRGDNVQEFFNSNEFIIMFILVLAIPFIYGFIFYKFWSWSKYK